MLNCWFIYRYSGVLAALSLAATLILYLHVQSVKDRLEEIQNALPTTKLTSQNDHRQNENFSFVYERVVKVRNYLKCEQELCRAV